jgi:CheY-like chemotaxis protein
VKEQPCILLVDDDVDDCELLEETLREVGITLTINVVHDGPAAFEFLKNLDGNLPKVIILDVNMPMMNGMEFLSKLNSLYTIPVIMYTTTCDDNLIREAKELGAIDCVKKGTSYVDGLKFAKRVAQLVGNCMPVT